MPAMEQSLAPNFSKGMERIAEEIENSYLSIVDRKARAAAILKKPNARAAGIPSSSARERKVV